MTQLSTTKAAHPRSGKSATAHRPSDRTADTATDVSDGLARLKQQFAALGDPGDVVCTYNTQAEYERDRSALDGRIRTIRTAQQTLDEVEPPIKRDQRWLKQLKAWREALTVERDALPESAYGIRMNLQLSIQTIDRGRAAHEGSGWDLETLRLGQLLRKAGYIEGEATEGRSYGALPWFGSTGEVEHRLRGLTARRDEANVRLERALSES